jgi:photosystem II stability/assembly factor-like uncharacterized protein
MKTTETMLRLKEKLQAGRSLFAAVSLVALFCACNALVGDRNENGQTGTLGIRITLDQAGNSVLGKTATGDTTFNLDSLKIILTSPGQTTQNLSYAITGNVAAGNVSITTKYVTVAALKTWQAKIISIDTTTSPVRYDTVHIDSVSFTVLPGDTTTISPSLTAKYSVLKERIVANFPDSVISPVRYLRMRIDGVMQDSIALGSGMNAVFFTSTTTGWAVGDYGVILATTNSGSTWLRQTSGTTKKLNSIFMASATVGWAVGDSGTVLKTANGTTWTAQTSGTTSHLNGVRGIAANTNNAFAVGNSGKVLQTTDGGTNWLTRTSGTTSDLNAVFATAATVAWAVGNGGTIIKTTNGSTWSAKTSGTAQHLYTVFFAPSSATQGWVGGANGTLHKTLDSSSWSARTSNTTQDLKSIFIQNATSTGFAVAKGGVIIKTTDSSSWSASQTSNTTENLSSVYAASVDVVYVAGSGAPFVSNATASSNSIWTANYMGSRGFDQILAFKRLTPGVSHTVLLQAIDTTAGPLRGFEITTDITVDAGRDSTITVNILDKCGYVGTPSCTP